MNKTGLKKSKKKSRECYNYKPQPFPDSGFVLTVPRRILCCSFSMFVFLSFNEWRFF